MKLAGLIYDNSTHYLDHLGPFCALMECPLIIIEEGLAHLAREYYPDLEVIESSPFEQNFPERVIACDPAPLVRAAFPQKEVKTIWLPHGRSDKGHTAPFFEALKGERIVLVYGRAMEQQLRQKEIEAEIVRIGNYRFEYFLKHKEFYRGKLPTQENKEKILYAPTWDDAENSCSFWNAFGSLAKGVKEHQNLYVKLHPNTVLQFEPEIEILIGKYGRGEQIHVLPEFPPIYPLLEQMDAYIGDMSSIGYDFLTFNRPMFFLNASNRFALHQCGKHINADTFDFLLREKHNPKSKLLYDETFENTPFERVKEKLLSLI